MGAGNTPHTTWHGLVVLSVLAVGCGSGTAPNSQHALQPLVNAEDGSGSEWTRTISGARAEGKVVIVLGSARSRDHRRIFQAFSERFGIEVVSTSGSGSANVQRLLAERARGRFTSDVILISSTAANRLRRSQALVPLGPLFIHPEVRDRSSGWMHTDYVWIGDVPGYVAAFRLAVSANIADIYFNSDKVSSEEISAVQAWQDLLDPRWRGRVVAILDPDARLTTSHWHAPWELLGRQWFDRFIREVRPKLLPESSQRELVDGLARGKYDLAVFLPSSAKREIERLGAAGMPVRRLRRSLAEGEVRELKGALGVLNRAPHPSAARLFVNWYLSREGQAAFHTLIESDEPSRSLRTDVPQGQVSDEVWAITAATLDSGNIRPDPELAAGALRESAAFIKSTCADVGCYGY